MKKYMYPAVMLLGAMALLFGCAAEPEKDVLKDTSEPDVTTQTSPPTNAVLSISTSGTLPEGSLIGGIDITVTLAAGVSLKSTSNTPETDAGVVVASGSAASNSTVVAAYSAPSGTEPGKARVLIANTNGFGTGEFATINCDVAAGNHPQAADFSFFNFTVKDLNGAAIVGLTPGFTADIR